MTTRSIVVAGRRPDLYKFLCKLCCTFASSGNHSRFCTVAMLHTSPLCCPVARNAIILANNLYVYVLGSILLLLLRIIVDCLPELFFFLRQKHHNVKKHTRYINSLPDVPTFFFRVRAALPILPTMRVRARHDHDRARADS